MVLVPVTILGGLPVVAAISSGKDADTPNGPGEYWMEVDALYWRRSDGTRGKEVGEAIYAKCDRVSYWDADVVEQANDWLAYNCPVRWRDHSAPDGYRTEGTWSAEYIALNGNPHISPAASPANQQPSGRVTTDGGKVQ